MSGFIENFWDKVSRKYLPKICKEFENKDEITVAVQHFWQMLGITMSVNVLAFLTIKYIFILTLCTYIFILIAEWPPEGRLVDILTRSMGWLPGAIVALFQVL